MSETYTYDAESQIKTAGGWSTLKDDEALLDAASLWGLVCQRVRVLTFPHIVHSLTKTVSIPPTPSNLATSTNPIRILASSLE
jgi:hypothetical protein